ncbi:MAG: 1-acyl-sn-glycerol-3-phosphate acyltransferase [Desulfobacterales bacterium]|nr:1-acyl-sn-glycerol-3-phosphate acyltransferase [Desulfobacterales bacterium]
MAYIRSAVLWTAGIIFFAVSFCILAVSLMTMPRPVTFTLARSLFSVQIRIMGIRLKVEGREHLDPSQTYLLMGNHESLFDLFVIPAALPLVFTGVEAAYHFNLPVWGYLIRKWGCIPIQRENLEEAKKSLELARQTLADGLSIAILPEGHRTRTGEMGPFKKGPFHLAKATGAPLLPFGISGLFEFQRRGGFIISPGVVTVRIGAPVPADAYGHLSVDELRALMFERIQTLSGDSL